MRYAIEEYTVDGFFKAPSWLLLGWIFLAREWVVFIAAAVSRLDTKVLNVLFPQHNFFYAELVMGVPALILLWLLGLRKAERPRVNRLCSHGKWITLFIIAYQLLFTTYLIYIDGAQYSWSNAVTLVGLLWFAIYLFNSRRVKECFNSCSI